MSNSIWHKRDETPKDFCDVVVADFRTGSCSVFLSPFHNLSFLYDRWCYLTDLIDQADKAERLQKAVDLAIQRLEQGKQKFGKSTMGPNKEVAMLCEIVIDEIKQLIKDGNNE